MSEKLTVEMLDELQRYLDVDCAELRLYQDRDTYRDWSYELNAVIAAARKGLKMETDSLKERLRNRDGDTVKTMEEALARIEELEAQLKLMDLACREWESKGL